jgi:hypothetical protein
MLLSWIMFFIFNAHPIQKIKKREVSLSNFLMKFQNTDALLLAPIYSIGWCSQKFFYPLNAVKGLTKGTYPNLYVEAPFLKM